MVNKRLFAILFVAVLMASVSFVSAVKETTENSENQGFFGSIFGKISGEQVRDGDSERDGFLRSIFGSGSKNENDDNQDSGENEGSPLETINEGEGGEEGGSGEESSERDSASNCCEVENSLVDIGATYDSSTSRNCNGPNCPDTQTFFDPSRNRYVKESYDSDGCLVRKSYDFSASANVDDCEYSIGAYYCGDNAEYKNGQWTNYKKKFNRTRWDASCLRQKFNQHNGTSNLDGPNTERHCGASVGDALTYSLSCGSGSPYGDSHGNYRSKTGAFDSSRITMCETNGKGYQANCPVNNGGPGGGSQNPGGSGSGRDTGCNNTDVQTGTKDYPTLSNGEESPVPEGEFTEQGETYNSQTTKEDRCSRNGELVEFYCTSDGVEKVEVDCSQVAGRGYSCVDGECVR